MVNKSFRASWREEVRRFARSLRFRILVLVLLATLPALGLAIYNGFVQRSLAAQGAQEDALRIAHLAANRQQALVEGARQLLIAVAQSPQIRSGDAEECTSILKQLQAQFTTYANLAVAELDGHVHCSSVSTPTEINIQDRPYFQDALKTEEFTIGDYTIDRFTGLAVLPFAYPVKNDAGQVTRVAVAIVRLDWIDAMASQVAFPENFSMLVVDRQGTILTRYPDPQLWSGKNLQDAPLIRAILLKKGEGTAESNGLDGVDRLFAFTALDANSPDSPYLTIGIPISVAYADANRSLRFNLIILGLVSVLALLAAWFFSDIFILRQVRSLVGATRRLATGDLSSRSGIDHDQGEVGFLARSFDRMAERLQEREIQLTEAEARYRTLVEQIPAVTYISEMQANGKMLYISPQIEAISGYSVQTWLETPDLWRRWVAPEDLEAINSQMDASRNGGQPLRVEYRTLSKTGETVWVRDEATIVRDAAGDALVRQGIIVDITKLRLAENALKDYAQQLERSNAELQDFAYIASHDLQEPLRKIQAFGERLEVKYNQQLDNSGKDYIQRMRSSAERMQTLINDLLSYSRVSTRGQAFGPVALNQVMKEALSNLETRVEETGGKVMVDDLPVIDADRVQMVQLFQNLIGNALKFHREGVSPEIRIGCEVVSQPNYPWTNMIRIYVQDNGIGFQEKYLDRIFLPFQRLHGRFEYEGSGIGLAICRKIAERHGGSLTATSKPGEGSTFYLTLPVHNSAGQKGDLDERQTRRYSDG